MRTVSIISIISLLRIKKDYEKYLQFKYKLVYRKLFIVGPSLLSICSFLFNWMKLNFMNLHLFVYSPSRKNCTSSTEHSILYIVLLNYYVLFLFLFDSSNIYSGSENLPVCNFNLDGMTGRAGNLGKKILKFCHFIGTWRTEL